MDSILNHMEAKREIFQKIILFICHPAIRYYII